MHRVVASVACVVLGCAVTTTQWQAVPPHIPEGSHAFVVTADRAIELENVHQSGIHVAGHVIRVWTLPPGAQIDAAETNDSPATTAARAGWGELPAANFLFVDVAAVQRVGVTVETRDARVARYVLIGAVAVVVLGALVTAPYWGPALGGG